MKSCSGSGGVVWEGSGLVGPAMLRDRMGGSEARASRNTQSPMSADLENKEYAKCQVLATNPHKDAAHANERRCQDEPEVEQPVVKCSRLLLKLLQAFDLSHLAADFERDELVELDELSSWSWIEFAATPLCKKIPMARARQLHRCFADVSARTAALDKLKQAQGASSTAMTQKPSQSRSGEVGSAPTPRVPKECFQGGPLPPKRAKTSSPAEGSCVEEMLQDVPPGCSLKKCPSLVISSI